MYVKWQLTTSNNVDSLNFLDLLDVFLPFKYKFTNAIVITIVAAWATKTNYVYYLSKGIQALYYE